MNPFDFLNDERIDNINKKYLLVQKEKAKAAFNIFSVSSYNSYLENYHSDIICALLDPYGNHGQENAFLQLFVYYLNQSYKLNLDISDFQNAQVIREEGRIDIWIRDMESLKSIIIENKINNAPDMERQIERYHDHVSGRLHNVEAIIYLSLDGNKLAPKTNTPIDDLVINIGAFTGRQNDLVNGWLVPCLNFSKPLHDDCFSFLNQYIHLLKNLGHMNLDKEQLFNLYNFINEFGAFEKVGNVLELFNRIPSFRADRFMEGLGDIKPFKKAYRYRPNVWLIEKYSLGNYDYKIDVEFSKDGNAEIDLWLPSLPGPEGRKVLTEKLTEIQMLDDFCEEKNYGGNGFTKYFEFKGQNKPLSEVDDEVLFFIRKLISALANSESDILS